MHVTVDPLHAAVIALLLAGSWAFWWTRLRDATGPRLSGADRIVSWALIAVYFTWKAFLYEERDDVLALVDSGMSASNRIEAAFTGLVGLWAAWLLVSRRMPPLRLVQGAGFWVGALVAVDVASAGWSVWPDFTIYKSMELAVFWVVTAHLFSAGSWRNTLEWLCVWAVAGSWLPFVTGAAPRDFSHGLIGAFYDNGAATMAGALLLVAVHRLLRHRDVWAKGMVAFALLSLLLFHSFTTYLCLAMALPALLVLAFIPRASALATVLLIAGTIGAGGSIAWLTAKSQPDLVLAVGAAVGKDADELGTATGRLPLWEAMWEVSKDHAFGTGFLAVERMIPQLVAEDVVGWVAAHSHNGFLSAWLAAGWLGLGLVLFLVAALGLQATGLDPPLRALAIPFILFVMANNMSYPAVGGRLNGAWLMIMGLAYATAPRPTRAAVPVAAVDPGPVRAAPAPRWGAGWKDVR